MHVRKTAAARKSEIIDATLRLADKVGPDGLTTKEIAEDVGLTQPGIFRHFPRKQDIWEAVAERIGSMMERRWTEAQTSEGSFSEQIGTIIAAQLRLIQSTPAIPAILFSRELHSKNKGLRKAFFILLSRFHRMIAELVIQGQDAGEFCKELKADDAAFLIVGLVQGLAVRWSISGRDFDLTQEGLRLLDLQLLSFIEARKARSGGRAPTP